MALLDLIVLLLAVGALALWWYVRRQRESVDAETAQLAAARSPPAAPAQSTPPEEFNEDAGKLVSAAQEALRAQAVKQRSFFQQQRKLVREECIAGLRVLAYVLPADDVRSSAEQAAAGAFIAERLRACGQEGNADLKQAMMTEFLELSVPERSFKAAVTKLTRNPDAFRQAFDRATEIAAGSPQAGPALAHMRDKGQRLGLFKDC